MKMRRRRQRRNTTNRRRNRRRIIPRTPSRLINPKRPYLPAHAHNIRQRVQVRVARVVKREHFIVAVIVKDELDN